MSEIVRLGVCSSEDDLAKRRRLTERCYDYFVENLDNCTTAEQREIYLLTAMILGTEVQKLSISSLGSTIPKITEEMLNNLASEYVPAKEVSSNTHCPYPHKRNRVKSRNYFKG